MIAFNRAVVHCGTETDVTDRLDEAKIAQLRAWAVALAGDGDDELRAAGKAILLLIEEIERSHIDVNAKPPEEQHQPEARAVGDDRREPAMDRTLRSRLSRIRTRTLIDDD
jgi:hypothetical protein